MRRTALILALSASLLTAAEDGGEQHGMDVIGATKTVKSWFGPGEAPTDKPWANALGAITDPDPRIHSKAIRDLAGFGQRNPAVLTDLTVLAGDKDWKLRARIVQVCAAIGGESATPLLLRFSEDRERRVRELAALGLAQGAGVPARERLVAMLGAPESEIRQAAAQSLGAFGDPLAIEPLTHQEYEQDDLVKRAMRQSLIRLAADQRAVPTVVDLLGRQRDEQRDALVEAVVDLPDPRLCPPLAAIANDPGRAGRSPEASAWTQFLAVRALSASGDWRAVPVLIGLADSEAASEVRESAASALRLITGYGAAPGKAWRVWATDNAARTERLGQRDAWLAGLRDPTAAIERAAVGAWTVAELEPLVQAVLNRPAGRITAQWAAHALDVLRADDPLRWTPVLAERIDKLPTSDADTRLGLIILLDDLAPHDRVEDLAKVAAELKTRMEQELDKSAELKVNPPDHGPEIALLGQALERRGVKARF
jgi:HEAT repeat protein